MKVPVFVLGPNDSGQPVYLAFNQIACEIAQLSEQSVLGKTARELYPGRLGIAAFNRHCAALQACKAMSYELTLPIGERDRRVRTHLEPVLNADGQLLYIVGTSEDISMNQDIIDMQAYATSINAEMEQFISLAAHDLRSPIRRVRSIANLLREEIPPAEKDSLDLLSMLENVATKSMSVISEVISHALATGAPESVEKFDLASLVEDLMIGLDPAGDHSCNYPDCWIFGDRVATQITIRNLIDNALKHNQGQIVAISVVAADQGTSHFEIAISDNGKGLADPTKLFVEAGKTGAESGFGLAGVRRLITSRNGTISAGNKAENRGTVVRFSLPGSILGKG